MRYALSLLALLAALSGGGCASTGRHCGFGPGPCECGAQGCGSDCGCGQGCGCEQGCGCGNEGCQGCESCGPTHHRRGLAHGLFGKKCEGCADGARHGLLENLWAGYCGGGGGGGSGGGGGGGGGGGPGGPQGPYAGAQPAPGPSAGAVAYPYYTTRGPRDFLRDNPPSIGPY